MLFSQARMPAQGPLPLAALIDFIHQAVAGMESCRTLWPCWWGSPNPRLLLPAPLYALQAVVTVMKHCAKGGDVSMVMCRVPRLPTNPPGVTDFSSTRASGLGSTSGARRREAEGGPWQSRGGMGGLGDLPKIII